MASAAVPIGATIPAAAGMSAASIPQPQTDRETLYLAGHYFHRSCGPEEYFLDMLVRRRETAEAYVAKQASDPLESSRAERRFIREQVVEFPHGDRYMTVTADWWYDDWMPEHALDIPTALDVDSEGWNDPDELFSRDDALALIAEQNRKLSDQTSGPERARFWNVCVQVGKPFRQSLWSISVEDGETGTERRTIERPVRLVRPTADEIAKYAPERWTWKEVEEETA
jgi:hypothetical protein